jgi:copper resistance protein D
MLDYFIIRASKYITFFIRRCSEMFVELRLLVTGIHIGIAIVWVKWLLFIGWGVYTVVRTMRFLDQRQFLISLMKRSHLTFTLAGSVVIGTGVLLGTVLGPIHHWNIIWNTRYGNIWIIEISLRLSN